MKKTNIFTTSILGLFLIFMSYEARAQTMPTCESMGYTMTESVCNSKNKPVLRCPLDSSKVFCGLTECDLIANVICGTNYTCSKYHPTCTSKCTGCKCTQTKPVGWDNAQDGSPLPRTCPNGFQAYNWCGLQRYRCCAQKDLVNCLAWREDF